MKIVAAKKILKANDQLAEENRQQLNSAGIFGVNLVGSPGCGKTTLGILLSQKLGWPFYDGDDYHPKENKEKMAAGIPLEDSDREPWLKILGTIISDHQKEEKSMILACSALKKSYRDLLGIDQKEVVSVYLKGSITVLKDHLAGRSHEYMDDDLLSSQLNTLEEPKSGITVDVSGLPEQTTEQIITMLSEYQHE